MATETITIKPDVRGRMTLGQLVEQDRSYVVDRLPDGSIVMSPVALVLTQEAYDDLLSDPYAFAERMKRAEAHAAGAPTVSVDEFWSLVDDEDAALESSAG